MGLAGHVILLVHFFPVLGAHCYPRQTHLLVEYGLRYNFIYPVENLCSSLFTKDKAVSFIISSDYNCDNVFASKQTDLADHAGENLGKMPFVQCAARCAVRMKCFGFDYTYSDESCRISTNSNYRLTYEANTVRYTTRFICYSEGKR